MLRSGKHVSQETGFSIVRTPLENAFGNATFPMLPGGRRYLIQAGLSSLPPELGPLPAQGALSPLPRYKT